MVQISGQELSSLTYILIDRKYIMASEDKEIRWSKTKIFKQSSARFKKKKEDDDEVTRAGRAFDVRDDEAYARVKGFISVLDDAGITIDEDEVEILELRPTYGSGLSGAKSAEKEK